ncbi:hypothetical protein BH11MYX4_BH11MYX4_01060 [soil metagenome]
MKKTLFAAALVGFLASCPMLASAGGSAKPAKEAAPTSVPASPKFVEYQNGFTWTMRIEGLGKKGDDDGYIQYDKYDFENANVVSNVSVQGIKGVKGVGEALKKHLLELYKESTFESDLIKTNRDKLLAAWSKSYPKALSSDELRSEVPALSQKFGNEFDFEIKAFPSKSGGSIHLWVKPKGSGRVTVVNPEGLNQMVLDDPQFRPESAKKEDEDAAKKKKDDAKKDPKKKK